MSDKPRKFKGGVHPNDSKALSASKPIQDAPLLCTVSYVVLEEGWNKLMKRASTWKDGSAILTGILL